MKSLKQLKKKDFDAGYHSGNEYTRSTVKEGCLAGYLSVLKKVATRLQNEHMLQQAEIIALYNAYIDAHIFDLSSGDNEIYLLGLMLSTQDLEIHESDLVKEFYCGDYLKIVGVVADNLNDDFNLNSQQLKSIFSAVVLNSIDDGEDI